ncbi:MAG: UDP-N-acetylmuramate--L-alanine ligase [Bacteroidia bacterium]
MKRIYFIGIGGIGMSALASYFKLKGHIVAGYDRTPSEITEMLKAQNIPVHFEDNVEQIPQEFREKNNVLVVYTPAVPASHSELNYFKNNGFEIKKRSQVLAEVVNFKYTIAVAGTHGKTTTAAMIVNILREAKMPMLAFLGGIATNIQSNFYSYENGKEAIAVAEADEFDRSFLQLNPDVAVITSMDSDHLDVYADADQLTAAYIEFSNRIRNKGTLAVRQGLNIKKPEIAEKLVSFGIEDDSDITAENIRIENGHFVFELNEKQKQTFTIKMLVPGRHNVLNALAAFAATANLVESPQQVKKGLESFTGVHRRFEYHLRTPEMVYVDDYAHHPEELRQTILALQELYPQKKVTGIFQPHLYSRTRDFAESFAQSLSLLDEVVLLPVYPAREEPIPGVDAEMILNRMTLADKHLVKKEHLLGFLQTHKVEVLATLGAGDIDRLAGPIANLLRQRLNEKHLAS